MGGDGIGEGHRIGILGVESGICVAVEEATNGRREKLAVDGGLKGPRERGPGCGEGRVRGP